MTPIITIERAFVSGVGTYGDLFLTDDTHNNELICHTIEREWRGNAPNISCIPDGDYWLEPYHSPTHGNCLIVHNELLGVTKFNNNEGMRWGILFHAENWPDRLQGCIAPCEYFDVTAWSNDNLVGVNSGKALKNLLKLLSGRTARLILKPKGANWWTTNRKP